LPGTRVLPQMFRTLCLSGPAGCTIKSMVGRAAEHGLNAAWEDTTAARSALKQSLAGAAMSAVAGTTGALQLVLLCLAAGVYWIKGVWVLFTHCYQPLQGDDGCGDTGRSFINVIDIALWSTLCRVAGIIIIINPCKPYLTASAPRLTHWGGGK
jgi:hypothetical protein